MSKSSSNFSPADAGRSPTASADRTQLLDRLRAVGDGLTDTALPDLRLASYMAGTASIHGLARDCAAIYLYPGTDSSPLEGGDSPSNDIAQHTAFNAHEILDAFGCRAIGISTETPGKQSLTILRHYVSQELLSDPEARLADVLGLPTFTTGDGRRAYHRMILVAKGWVVRRVLVPLAPERSGQEVYAFLQASRQHEMAARGGVK